MKAVKIIIAIFCICFLAGVFLLNISGCAGKGSAEKDVYYCPMHPSYTSDRPGDCPICNMKLVKKETESAKTMDETAIHEGHDMTAHKEKQEEKTHEEICLEHKCAMPDCQMVVKIDLRPGEKIICPICGEYITAETGKLVEPKEEEKAVPTVMISSEKQQLIGVKTAPVQKIELQKKIRAYGKIAYNPELAVVQEEFIQALNNEENVKDSPLKDMVERAKLLTDAARRKLILLGMSGEQIKQLEITRKPDKGLYLPEEGGSVWAYLSVYEYEIGIVKIGQSVEITAAAYRGEKFTGKVGSINPVLDPMTRTNQVRIEVSNPLGKLKPEMFVDGIIVVDLGAKLAVPDSAVLDTGIRKIVFLVKGEGLFESREIETGQKAEGYYEVVNGLNEGDVVVTSGNFLIDAESRLKSAISGGEHKH